MSSNSIALFNYIFALYSFVDSDGFPMGTDSTPDEVTNGSATSPYFYNRGISVEGYSQSIETLSARGGGVTWAKDSIPGEPADFALELSGKDTTLQGYWGGNTPDTTTASNVTVYAENNQNPNRPYFMSGHVSRAVNSSGDVKYITRIILRHKITPSSNQGASQNTGVNPNPLSYQVTPTPSSKLPWGQAISANANITVYDNRTYEIEIEADYPYAWTTYIDDGTATADAFSLGFVPAVTTIAGNYFVFNQGVDDASNVSVDAAGSVSLTAANTAGDKMVIFYPIPENPVATA